MPKGFLCKFLFFITSLTKIMYCTKRPGNICCLVEHTHTLIQTIKRLSDLVGGPYIPCDGSRRRSYRHLSLQFSRFQYVCKFGYCCFAITNVSMSPCLAFANVCFAVIVVVK